MLPSQQERRLGCRHADEKLNTVTVKQRLRRYHRAILQNAVGDLKVGDDTYAWFRMADRPSHLSDRLGPFRLMPRGPAAIAISAGDQERLYRYLGIDGQEWNRCGSVVVRLLRLVGNRDVHRHALRGPSWR